MEKKSAQKNKHVERQIHYRDKNRKSTCEEIKNKQNKIDIAYTSIQIIERGLIFSLNVVCSRNIQATVFFYQEGFSLSFSCSHTLKSVWFWEWSQLVFDPSSWLLVQGPGCTRARCCLCSTLSKWTVFINQSLPRLWRVHESSTETTQPK